jgi:hypothetical protein
MTRTSQILLEIPRDNKTDNNGEFRFTTKLNTTYIRFGTLEVWVGFDEVWSQWWPPLYLLPGTICTSLTMPVGKRVTILTDVDAILKDSYYRLEFYNTIEEVKEESDGTRKYNVTTYKYSAEIWKTTGYSYTKLGKINERQEKYIGLYFKMKLGPDDYRTNIEQSFNYVMDLNGDGTMKAVANFYKIYDKRLENELKSTNDDIALTTLISANIYSRVTFKYVWQLKIPPWSNLQRVMAMYKNYILNSKFVDPSLIASTFDYSYFTTLQSTLNDMLRYAYIAAAISSPAFLYSLTLTTGNYKCILGAIQGSISTILRSLIIGLAETKGWTKCYLDAHTWASGFLYTLLAFAIGSIPGGQIPALILELAGIGITVAENYYLKENAYSPQFLRNLVKITEYDLTLLNYEIDLWNQLKD